VRWAHLCWALLPTKKMGSGQEKLGEKTGLQVSLGQIDWAHGHYLSSKKEFLYIVLSFVNVLYRGCKYTKVKFQI